MADDELAAELAAIKDRAEKATRGPWKVERKHGFDADGAPSATDAVIGPDWQTVLETLADLRFAAHAREDVPRLVKAVEGMLKGHVREETDWGPVCGGCWNRLGKNSWPCPTVLAAAEALLLTEAPKPEPFKRPEGCICAMFRDTGGFRIADLTCPVHGVGGTNPGDGNWEKTGTETDHG